MTGNGEVMKTRRLCVENSRGQPIWQYRSNQLIAEAWQHSEISAFQRRRKAAAKAAITVIFESGIRQLTMALSS